MPTATLVRAWVDLDFRGTLSADDLETLPEHPAGDLDAELNQLNVHDACWETSNCTKWSPTMCCC